MKTATAIRNFISTPGYNPTMDYPKPSMAEIKEFKTSCTPEEWNSFGQGACDALGEVWEA